MDDYEKQASFPSVKPIPQDIKEYDTVICVLVHDQSHKNLTIMKEYTVIGVSESYFSIKNDRGKKSRYKKHNQMFMFKSN